jgi:hypothetical protein
MTSNQPFGRVLAELLINSGYVRKNSNPDWVGFVAALQGVSYETLRKAVADERPVSETLMRKVALGLNVEPTVFTEYSLMQARRNLNPGEVGWARAVETLARLEGSEQAAGPDPGHAGASTAPTI